MYDKQKMMYVYAVVCIGGTIVKLLSQSIWLSTSLMPHIIVSAVLSVVIVTLALATRVPVNFRASAALLLLYAHDLVISTLDNQFLLTPLVLITLLLVGGTLIDISIVLATFIGCNLMTLIYCMFWPQVAFGTIGVHQVIFLVAIANAAGVLMYWLARWATRIIKEGNEKANEADRANEAKSLFLATVSHEIRTPMNAIFGMNELIMSAHESTNIAELKQRAAYIKSAGVDLLALINDILDISKIEQGRMELVMSPYSAEQMFQVLGRELRQQIGNKPISPHVEIDLPIAVDLIGDDVRIRQILSQFISNAAKFTKEGAIDLTVRQRQAEGGVLLVVSVRDTGCGLGPDSVERILQKREETYFKVNEESDGIGIGLSIAIRLLEMMDGTLAISSQLGKGSTFEISIPQQISPEPVKKIEEELSGTRPTLSGARVLVVDDNSTNIQVCRGIFKRYALDIETALSGREAVIKAQKTPYDLIFMDHMMPGMDGVDAMLAIHYLGDEHNKKVPIVVLTADNSQEQARSLIKRGFDAYLAKPIDTLELTRILRNYLGNFINDERDDMPAPQYALGLILPGVNVQKGIMSSGGTLNAYIDVLRVFLRTGPKHLKVFEQGMIQGELHALGMEAHSIKSVAGSIGAERLADLSRDVERAAKAGEMDTVQTLIGPLSSELQKLLETIEAALRDTDKPKADVDEQELDTGALIEQLEQLKAAAEDYDLETATTIFADLCDYNFPMEFAPRLGEIKTGIQSYAYAVTVETTQQFIDELRQSMALEGGEYK